MKPLNAVIIVVVAAAAFTAGYMTSTYRHRQQLEEARREAADFRKAEKALDKVFTIPDTRLKPKKEP